MGSTESTLYAITNIKAPLTSVFSDKLGAYMTNPDQCFITKKNLNLLYTEFLKNEKQFRKIDENKLLLKQILCFLLGVATIGVLILILRINSERKTGRCGTFFFRNDTIGFTTSTNTQNCDIISKEFTRLKREIS